LSLEHCTLRGTTTQLEVDPAQELENAFLGISVARNDKDEQSKSVEEGLSDESLKELVKMMRASQLKATLKEYKLDYADCLEKGELIDRLFSCEKWRSDTREESKRQMRNRPRIVEEVDLPDTCFAELKADENLVNQCLKLHIPAEVSAVSLNISQAYHSY